MGVYLSLNKSYIERTMQEANKRAIKNHPDDTDSLMWHFDKEPEIEIDESENILRLIFDGPIGYINVDVVLDIDAQIKLVEIAAKRLNKFKSLLESLK